MQATNRYDGFLLNPSKWAGCFTDFWNGLQATDPEWSSAVSVGVVADSGLVIANRVGMLRLSTGASATGFATVFARLLNWLTGPWYTRADVRTPASLSSAGQRYQLTVGLCDNATASDGTDGVFFRYRDDLNSGKWQCVARAASVDTTADSGVTVATSTWYKLEIRTNAAQTSADYFINGVKVATIASGLPGQSGLRPTAAILKSVGATDITLFLVDLLLGAIRVTR